MSATLALHPWNHAPRELPLATFETMRGWWMQSLRAKHAYLTDALSGSRLDIRTQLVPIEVTTKEHGKPLPACQLQATFAACGAR